MQPSRPFDGFVEYANRVSPTCLVHLDRNRYSVPASFANRPVSVRVYPERIVVVGEGQIVCEHRRVFVRSCLSSPQDAQGPRLARLCNVGIRCLLRPRLGCPSRFPFRGVLAQLAKAYFFAKADQVAA
jgi:hypothetical protein